MKPTSASGISFAALLIVAACGGGGGGGNDIPNLPPTLSNLQISADTFTVNDDGGTAVITATVDYSDPEADIASIHILVAGRPEAAVPIEGPLTDPSGTLIGEFEFSTTQSGVFPVEVWAVDRNRNESNRLALTITIIGSTNLTELSISASPLTPFFVPQFTGAYTAIVGMMTAVTTVTATSEDPNAEISINGELASSGVASGAIPLGFGENTIDVAVSSARGAALETYTIKVLRNAVDVTQRAYVKASNASFDDYFGESLAISGDTLVVSGRLEDSGATGINGDETDVVFKPDAGAAYIFVRDPVGGWAQQAYVKASNTDSADYFGSAVAIAGDTVAVGASWEASTATGINGDQADNGFSGAGAVYVFTRDIDMNWSQQAYIKSSRPPTLTPAFGSALALDGDTLAVGAPGESLSPGDIGTEHSGGVYVFFRDAAGAWIELQRLMAPDVGPLDQFGSALALEGNTLIIGAPESFACTGCDTSIETGGRVYVFTRDGAGVWTQQARLQPDSIGMFSRFGAALALEGDTLVVAAPQDSGNTGGSVFVYAREANGNWAEQAQIRGFDTDSADTFGSSVALENGALVVGASGRDNDGISSGAAYLFTRNATEQWEQQALFLANNRDDGDAFGSAVASNGTTLIIGAMFEDSAATGIEGDQSDNSAPQAGAVYVFE